VEVWKMGRIRGEERVPQVVMRLRMPQPTVKRVERFQEFIKSLNREITVEEVVVRAVEDALDGDREFSAWERRDGSGQSVAAKPVKPRAERKLKTVVPEYEMVSS
jgi:hypothetical protein